MFVYIFNIIDIMNREIYSSSILAENQLIQLPPAPFLSLHYKSSFPQQSHATNISFNPQQRFIPLLNKNFHVITEHKLHFRLNSLFLYLFNFMLQGPTFEVNFVSSMFDHGVIILNRSNNSQISIETSAPQQAGGFIKNTTLEFQILPQADKKGLLLTHQQTIGVQSVSRVSLCQDMRSLLDFP